ncbi:MBL fold metallo-hydrolase [Rhodococcus sp. NKCM2511]|uniref:MBL fold metallo-hydrolase n=1 Tax=Rhodococcus sp. NKCM2511 TaxID=2766011 RepID=UPI001910E834|nr:MBL fold metallo-hydrolase [Rhodococcus sp. NKCM2511]GHP18558.1 MBL fold metallo-hydrolase [Rhodococcus sp. NKCM2511]
MSGSREAIPLPGVAVRVAPRVERLLAPNAGAWTFEGTNTWLIGAPDASQCAVIDPGPADAGHLESILAAAGRRTVTEIVLTHGHNDHADGAHALAERTKAPVLAQRAVFGRTPIEHLQRMVLAGHVTARILGTPGHTRDSVCVSLPDDDAVLTGDTLLGGGSPVVHPALLAGMIESLRMLAEVGHGGSTVGLPGHGPVIADVEAAALYRVAARRRRIEQVAALRNSGTTEVEDLVGVMYRHIEDPDVLKAAHSSVESMVVFLESGFGSPTTNSGRRQ